MSLFPKFKIAPKTPATPATTATTATFQPKCSESSNCSNPLGTDSPSYEKGWEKCFPVKGDPFWRKDDIRIKITGDELERLMSTKSPSKAEFPANK